MTLREIAAGKVTMDNVDELPNELDSQEEISEDNNETVTSQDV